MSNRRDNEYQVDQTIGKVSQAIIVLKGVDKVEALKQAVFGTMVMMSQYDVKNSGYVGNYEHGKFKYIVKAWQEQEMPVEVFEVDFPADMEEISLMAELETVPMNFIDEDSTVMILGPFDSKRIKFFTQNCKAL